MNLGAVSASLGTPPIQVAAASRARLRAAAIGETALRQSGVRLSEVVEQTRSDLTRDPASWMRTTAGSYYSQIYLAGTEVANRLRGEYAETIINIRNIVGMIETARSIGGVVRNSFQVGSMAASSAQMMGSIPGAIQKFRNLASQAGGGFAGIAAGLATPGGIGALAGIAAFLFTLFQPHPDPEPEATFLERLHVRPSTDHLFDILNSVSAWREEWTPSPYWRERLGNDSVLRQNLFGGPVGTTNGTLRHAIFSQLAKNEEYNYEAIRCWMSDSSTPAVRQVCYGDPYVTDSFCTGRGQREGELPYGVRGDPAVWNRGPWDGQDQWGYEYSRCSHNLDGIGLRILYARVKMYLRVARLYNVLASTGSGRASLPVFNGRDFDGDMLAEAYAWWSGETFTAQVGTLVLNLEGGVVSPRHIQVYSNDSGWDGPPEAMQPFPIVGENPAIDTDSRDLPRIRKVPWAIWEYASQLVDGGLDRIFAQEPGGTRNYAINFLRSQNVAPPIPGGQLPISTGGQLAPQQTPTREYAAAMEAARQRAAQADRTRLRLTEERRKRRRKIFVFGTIATAAAVSAVLVSRRN